MPEKEMPRGDGLTHRILLHYGLGALFLLLVVLLWFASHLLLLIFSGILLAVLISSTAGFFMRWLRLPRGLAVTLVVLLGVAILGLGIWLLAPRVSEQAPLLINSVTKAINRVREFVAQNLPADVLKQVPAAEQAPALENLVARAARVFTGVFGVVANMVIVLFLGIYLALAPDTYINGLVKLFPKPRRARIREVLDTVGEVLGRWLLGQLLLMVTIGTLTAVSLLLLGVPLALAVGLIAGLFEFIPYLGPILAGTLAVLVAFSMQPELALYVLLVFMAIQIAESYVLQPLIQHRMVSMPPALTISVQVLFALPFGILGLALATPLAAMAAVLISMLYVQDVLEDKVRLPGSH